MSWNDIVFGTGTVVFIIALIPAILSQQKPPVSTSLLNALILYVFAVNHYTLRLWYAMTATFITATLWAVLAVQRYRQKPVKEKV